MKTYFVIGAVILSMAGTIINLVGNNATLKVANDNLAATVLYQSKERERITALNIEKNEEITRLATELGAVKHELENLPGTKEYGMCKQADLPDGYVDRIKRLRNAGRRGTGVP